MTIADQTYTDCGPHQEPDWWSSRCTGCQHGLMVHRTVHGSEEIINDGSVEIVSTTQMICDMCALAAEITARAQNFAENLKDQAVEYVNTKQTEAKAYVDKEIVDTKSVVRQYVDDQDAKIRTELPVWVNNRLVQVVKVEALKIDPRL